MKRANREPYLALTRVRLPSRGAPSLCDFCHYARWTGGCDIVNLDCLHPLDRHELWEPFEVWIGDGADCWGFRPLADLDKAADMVGIWLRGEAVAVMEARQ